MYRNAAQTDSFVGSKVCAACHMRVYQTYRRTAMGRSMAPASQPSELEKVPRPVTVFKEKFNRYFQVFREGSNLYQSEYETDAGGRTVFKVTHKLEYAVGAGMSGFSYVVRRGDYLFEAPLSFYSDTRQWDLSPGYEFVDHGFSRPILLGCIVCHSGQPQAVPQRIGLYKDPPFRDLAIGCENCHGPGRLHVQKRSKGKVAGPDASIVNPARLTARLADDICMNCHQGGATRVLQPGKDYTDFRSGTPLFQTTAIFKLPLKQDQRELADTLERLPPIRGSVSMPAWWKNSSIQMSKCYRASNGRLSCLSCHDPHMTPSALEKAAYYRGKCLSCHTDSSCLLPRTQRAQQQPANDCAGCHMPKRPVGGISHSSSTNHRIMARPGQPLPEAAFDRSTPLLPGLVLLNKPEGVDEQSLSPLTLLAAYGELMEKAPDLKERYLEVLERLRKSMPDDPVVLAALGRKALLENDPRAADYLSRAMERGSESLNVYADLGDALTKEGRTEDAARMYERGVALYPYSPMLSKSLILSYITLRRYTHAHEAMKRHMELFPEDTFMRGLLEKVETAGARR